MTPPRVPPMPLAHASAVFLALPARVLVDGDERRDAFALGELAADDVAGAFRRDHDHVHVLGRHDGLEVDGEAVGEEQRLALFQVRRDVRVIYGGNAGIGHGDKDHVGALDGLGGIEDLEALFLRDRAGLAAGVKADDDFDAAVLEIERVGVALGAEADDGAGFAFERVRGWRLCQCRFLRP